MQFAPSAAELAAAIARLLDEQVVGAVPAHLQHAVRVAGHLASRGSARPTRRANTSC
jgi:hypothetical protein